jgi:CubicO group peptidase (beta-lactamase class C family)
MKSKAQCILGILALAAAILPAGAQPSSLPQDADPGAWQNSAQLTDEPEGGATTCDKNLLKAVSVQGINPAYTSKETYSSALIPSVGFATPDMAAAIDPTVANFMNIYGIPGGIVAMTYKDKLIFAKAYGYIDEKSGDFAEPDSRMRVASVSKALTAMGIMKLVHDGKLKLGDHPFPFKDVGQIIAGSPNNLFYAGQSSAGNPNYNSQLSQITVDDLLHHAGGWNRDEPGAPDLTGYPVLQMLATFLTEQTGKPSGPPDCTHLLGYVESQPLQVAPPTKETHYSNIGFCALSEVIQETSGKSFYDYIQDDVLDWLEMNDTTMGSTKESKRQDRESVYYDTNPAQPPQPSLFPPYNTVTEPYSSIGALESLGGAGGFVTTAIDLVHFGGAIANGRPANLLGKTGVWPQDYYKDSGALPSYECVDSSAIEPKGTYPVSDSCTSRGFTKAEESSHLPYGAGWDVAQPNVVATPVHAYDNYNLIKDGGFPGTVSSLILTGDGYAFAAVFNLNDNTIPGADASFFWPGCATPTKPPSPLPASSDNNCVLQAAYNHAAATPWDVDFTPQFVGHYTDWVDEAGFKADLILAAGLGSNYPSRIEGRQGASGYEYRARFGASAKSNYLYGKSCSDVLSAVESAPSSTPLVSLQRFKDKSGTYMYQAAWSAPIP